MSGEKQIECPEIGHLTESDTVKNLYKINVTRKVY